MDMKIRHVPDEVHQKFKILCIKRGITMNDQLIEYMKKEVQKAEKQNVI